MALQVTQTGGKELADVVDAMLASVVCSSQLAAWQRNCLLTNFMIK